MQIAATSVDLRRTLKTDEATLLGQCGEEDSRKLEVVKLEVSGFITTERDAHYPRVSLP